MEKNNNVELLTDDRLHAAVVSGSSSGNYIPGRLYKKRIEGDFLIEEVFINGVLNHEIYRLMLFSVAREKLIGRKIIDVKISGAYDSIIRIELDDGTTIDCYDTEQDGTEFGFEINGVDVTAQKLPDG